MLFSLAGETRELYTVDIRQALLICWKSTSQESPAMTIGSLANRAYFALATISPDGINRNQKHDQPKDSSADSFYSPRGLCGREGRWRSE